MVMERRKFLASVGAIGTGLSLSGCVGGGNSGGGGGGGSGSMPDPYRIGANGPSAPVWEFPAFPMFGSRLEEDHGSETERAAFMGFTDVVSGVVSEEAEICYLSLQALINARAEDLPIVAFLANTNEYNFPILVSNSIGGWEDLQGNTIAIQDTSAVSYASTRAMVNEELGDPDAVEYQVLAGTENRLAAIESGEVEAAAVFTSGALAAENEGYGQILGYPWDYDVTRNQTTLVWATLEPNIESQQDMLDQSVEYFLDSQTAIYEEDPETLVDNAMETGVYAEFGRDIWLESLKTARENNLWSDDGVVTEEQVTRGQDLLIQAGLLEEGDRVSADDVFVDDFV